MKKFLFASAAITSLAMAAPAHATATINGSSVIFDGTNLGNAAANTAIIDFNGIGGDPKAVVPGLSATLSLTLASISSTTFLFNYTLTNTSTAANARVSGMGFDVDPNVSGVSSTGVFGTGSLGGFTASYISDTCFSDGNANNCPQGQGNSGVFFGTPGSGTLSLIYGSAPASVTLSNFLDRYQGFNVGGVTSAVGQGTPIRGGGVTVPVPEPSTWAMMLVGFGLIGATMRRRQKATVRLNFA